MIRCLAVDAHPCLLAGLTRLFDAHVWLQLAATAATGEAALEMAASVKPDLVIVESRLPGTDGAALVRQMCEATPGCAVVVYSAHGDRRLVSDSLAAGARGYVLKSSPADDLIRALRSVVDGDAYVDPALSAMLLMNGGGTDAPLPDRERRILQLLAEGLRTDDVAGEVGLSSETVKAETKRAVTRLGASGRVHAVAQALREGYIG